MVARATLLVVYGLFGVFVAGCGDDPLSSWPSESAVFESDVLALINERRDEGAVCGSEPFEPTHPLVMNDLLQRAARRHSLDMVDRMFFSHVNPDGDDPLDRIERTGYEGRTWGENIAAGSTSPEAVMELWMGSEGHCANIMSSDFEEIGVGFLELHWTLNFAAPR
jgi:uncharacterized protein YkwD